MNEEQENTEFEEINDFENIAADIDQNLDKLFDSTDRFFKRKLMMFCIRWTITLVLLYLFLDTYPWIKYIMYAAIPLGILNLILIFWGRKKINQKLAETKDKINSI